MVRCRKQHKGKEKVVRARGKRTHGARTAHTARVFPPEITPGCKSRFDPRRAYHTTIFITHCASAKF